MEAIHSGCSCCASNPHTHLANLTADTRAWYFVWFAFCVRFIKMVSPVCDRHSPQRPSEAININLGLFNIYIFGVVFGGTNHKSWRFGNRESKRACIRWARRSHILWSHLYLTIVARRKHIYTDINSNKHGRGRRDLLNVKPLSSSFILVICKKFRTEWTQGLPDVATLRTTPRKEDTTNRSVQHINFGCYWVRQQHPSLSSVSQFTQNGLAELLSVSRGMNLNMSEVYSGCRD